MLERNCEEKQCFALTIVKNINLIPDKLFMMIKLILNFITTTVWYQFYIIKGSIGGLLLGKFHNTIQQTSFSKWQSKYLHFHPGFLNFLNLPIICFFFVLTMYELFIIEYFANYYKLYDFRRHLITWWTIWYRNIQLLILHL